MQESGVTYLADAHISGKLIKILRHVGEKSILSVQKVFAEGVNDEVWIPKATERGFVCITYDRRMLGNDAILPFLIEAEARVIFIGSHLARAKLWDQALWMLRYWRKIRQYATSLQAGQCIRVHKNGRISPLQLDDQANASPRPTKRSKLQPEEPGSSLWGTA